MGTRGFVWWPSCTTVNYCKDFAQYHCTSAQCDWCSLAWNIQSWHSCWKFSIKQCHKKKACGLYLFCVWPVNALYADVYGIVSGLITVWCYCSRRIFFSMVNFLCVLFFISVPPLGYCSSTWDLSNSAWSAGGRLQLNTRTLHHWVIPVPMPGSQVGVHTATCAWASLSVNGQPIKRVRD